MTPTNTDQQPARKRFECELAQRDFDTLAEICVDIPEARIGGFSSKDASSKGRDELAKRLRRVFGKYGVDFRTVQPMDRGPCWFTAELLPGHIRPAAQCVHGQESESKEDGDEVQS